jgi:crotonobetainyl-CoA:carnitine CoA-transferase CaiB-like acyl-CoA transferase
MIKSVEWHTRDILDVIGVPAETAQLEFEGEEMRTASPLRLECAASASLGAQAVAAAHVWHRRNGATQNIKINRTQGLNSLRSGLFQWINGHDMNIYANGAKGAVSNLYQTADDRWIYLVGPYPGLRDGMLGLLGCANNEEAIAAAVRTWNSADLEDEIGRRGLAGAIVNTRDEWERHPQAPLLRDAPLIEIIQLCDSPARPLAPAVRPLSGVRVIDFTHVIAGPSLTRTLAEHGADVLRLASPRHPDPDAFLLDTGWGKRSTYLDLDLPGSMDKLDELLAETDIFVQSWSPGSIARRGLTARELCEKYPGLIYVEVNAFGFDGPWADRKGFEQLAQSVTGVAAAEGGGGRPSLVPTSLLADYLCAFLGAAGAMAALQRRADDGGSYHVRLSLTKAVMWVQELGEIPATTAALPEPVLVQRETPFGLLTHMAPVAEFSATPAEWVLPPCPPGAHPARW